MTTSLREKAEELAIWQLCIEDGVKGMSDEELSDYLHSAWFDYSQKGEWMHGTTLYYRNIPDVLERVKTERERQDTVRSLSLGS